MSKKIASLRVIKPGSNPDVDSDFNTKSRALVIDHVREVYGNDNVAAIGTNVTLAAKNAFKVMCTIYNVPFATAQKFSNLIPQGAEGMEVTMASIFNPKSEAYGASVDFRAAVAGEEWKKIIEGAIAIEGRNKAISVHPCGIVISSRPLQETIPLTVRQDDGLVSSQWGYAELESLGLIKMDFLGLDTVDLIQHTVENIAANGKVAPNMLDIIHGPMDDKKTFQLLTRGETIGLFQLASSGVQDLLKRIKPTSVEDIVAITALYRPGPMGMNSHIKYADRKNGKEPVDYIHRDFNGSPLEDILGNTYGLCIPKGTPILNGSTGLYEAIEELKEGTLTPSLNQTTGKLELKPITRVVATGTKRILTLRLNGGITLKVSETHPVLTDHGFVKAGELRRGDKLRLGVEALDIPSPEKEISPDQAYFLGVMLEDGALSQENQPSFTTSDDSVLDEMRRIARGLGAANTRVFYLKRNSTVMTKGASFGERDFSNPVGSWLKNVGARDMRSIPSKVFRHSNEILAHVAAGLWDAKGTVSPRGLHYTTTSKELFEGLQAIFSRLGIDFGVGVTPLRRGYRIYPDPADFRDKLQPLLRDKKKRLYGLKPSKTSGEVYKTLMGINYSGQEECFDLEVADNHNFLVNRVVVHNCVFQEQILKIANQIAGMTLQEGDDLRKAMGKKIIPKMAAAKPKFIAGGMANGYSQEAMETLWDTIAEFAKYGFNLAHSVAYAINAYQTAYLKANYPVEFMAALIAQNVNDRDKTLTYLKEARRMGIKVGSVDINLSMEKVAPDYKNGSDFDILYGLGGINSVSLETANTILHEREAHGPFTSVQNVLDRCIPLGVSNKKIYENLAKGGAFDGFGVSRRAVVENLAALLTASKTKKAQGASLFDMFGGDQDASSIDLVSMAEYPHVQRLQLEAEVVGLYLTDHPLGKMGKGSGDARSTTVANLLNVQQQSQVALTVAVTDIMRKRMKRGGKHVVLTLDDGTGYVNAKLSQELVKGIDKKIAQDRIRKLYMEGETELLDELVTMALNSSVAPHEDIEQNGIYRVTLTFRPARGESPYGAMIHTIEPLELSDDGSLPIRMRFIADQDHLARSKKLMEKLPKAVAQHNPGTYPIFTAMAQKEKLLKLDEDRVYRAAIEEIKERGRNQGPVARGTVKGADGLWGETTKKKFKNKKDLLPWPPPQVKDPYIPMTPEEILGSLTYVDSGYRADKNKQTELDIEKYLGAENYDFGVFSEKILEV